MKRILLLSMIFATGMVYAQNYDISFAATGVSSTLDSVKVENLTKGTKITLSGTDVLHLTGTNSINNYSSADATPLVYPNPMQDQTILVFSTQHTGSTVIIISDISGKEIIKTSKVLSEGINKFDIMGLKEGIYLINIKGDNYCYNVKLLTSQSILNTPSIKYSGYSKTESSGYVLKSTKSTVNMFYTTGDNLRYTGYSGTYSSTVNDVATNSKTITFTFVALPTLTTTTLSAITDISAASGGNITSDGSAAVTSRGVCWDLTPNPAISGSNTKNGTGMGTFISDITGLVANTKYYVRAYATNSVGTAYGNELSFTTLTSLPILTTTSITSITQTSATSGGKITSDGGKMITVRGVCWSLSQNPTISDSFTSDGADTGSFSSILTGLTQSTKYYVRAYATNSIGTSYGNELNFFTNGVPSVSTADITDVRGNSAKAGGTILYSGGSSVTAKGLCWSTSPDPTTSNSKTTSFTTKMSSLSPNTVYYVRAYATNSNGTGYGNEIVFNSGYLMGATNAGGLVFYNDGNGHGLVCTSSDQASSTEWGCSGTYIGGTSKAFSTGAANTNIIATACTESGKAAIICANLNKNSYDDWYLPSNDELAFMYDNLHDQGLGGFSTYGYWSSSESSSTYAWGINFSDGSSLSVLKFNIFHVRAIRNF